MFSPSEFTVTFAYQSQNIPFSDWISLFTVCLAPLLAHIMSGAPEPIVLTDTPPHWSDRLYLWNPMTITWRYFIIVDRRVRATNWTPRSMADINAVFWTDSGWRGCDYLEENPNIICTKLPSGTAIPWISSSAAKTLIVTLQGFQIVYLCMLALLERTFQISIRSIFFAISFISLLRLPAAPWLTEEFGYCNALKSGQDSEDSSWQQSDPTAPSSPPASSSSSSLRPQSSRGALVLRAYFLLWNTCSLALNILFWFCPGPLCPVCRSSTAFLRQIVFLAIIVGKTSLFYLYIVTGKTASPILPCQNARWYKAYTWLLVVLSLALLFVSVLETRRDKDGGYTSVPDIPACRYKKVWETA